MSSIERWPDQNYAPQALDYMCTVAPRSLQIITLLHGYAAEDVHVDLARGCAIILIARDEHMASAESHEYYCEVPIPPDTKPNIAHVEIKGDFVTIHLERKKVSVIQRVIVEIMRWKNERALLLGNGRMVRLFDDDQAV